MRQKKARASASRSSKLQSAPKNYLTANPQIDHFFSRNFRDRKLLTRSIPVLLRMSAEPN